MPALAILLTVYAESAIAQPTPLQCVATASVSPPARFEGLSEPVGDLVVNCIGGTPTAAGSPIPPVNIQVFLNTSLTSRLLATVQSEALLLIDEPTPASQRVCGTTGDVEAGGVCTITGTGTGLGVYNGTAARPNVFQGIQTALNSVTFLGVPIDPPGAGPSRVLRITNIRANANALGVGGQNPTPIVELISATPFQFLPVSNPVQTVAFIQRGLTTSVSGIPSFLRCVSQNGNLAGDPSQSGMSQFSVRFGENFPTAFKRRNVATSNATPTALANQNDLTVGTYNTETSFFNSGFPAIAGRGNLGLAGLADQGTRFLISFQNIPAGVSLFSQVSATVSGGTDVVRRVATDSVGSGPYSPVSGNAFGIAPIPLVGGSGTAAFEVIQSDPLASATVSIPIYVAYDVASAAPSLGTAVVFGNLAPLSSVTVADATAPVPRFASTASALNAFTITDCPSLSLTKTADAASVSAGSQIGFTVTASNSAAAGTVTASDVMLNDALPAGNGVSWSIASGPANCSIQGAVPTQSLVCTAVSLAAGASEAVHVTSATTAASCASYANTATLAATNASPLTANASTTVLCPAPNIPTLSPAILAALMLLLGAAGMITVKRR